MRSLVYTSLAVGLVVAGCGPKTTPPATPAPAAPPAAVSTPPSTPPPAAAPAAQAQAPPPPAAATPPSGAPAAPAADAPTGRGGRGRGGPPPPPPPPPPAVMPPPVTPIVSATAPTPDPRVGLKPGRWDAAQAAWNIKMISTTPPTEKFLGVTNSDLAFTGKYTIQGNYNGFQIYDISNPLKPVVVLTYVCPASQSDVSVYKNLLFVSGEGQAGRTRLRHPGRARAGEQGPAARHPHLRHRGHGQPEVRDQRADLPRVAHAHGGHRSA